MFSISSWLLFSTIHFRFQAHPQQKVGSTGDVSGGSIGGGAGDKDKKKKESVVDLARFLDKAVRVKFQGGREGKL